MQMTKSEWTIKWLGKEENESRQRRNETLQDDNGEKEPETEFKKKRKHIFAWTGKPNAS